MGESWLGFYTKRKMGSDLRLESTRVELCGP